MHSRCERLRGLSPAAANKRLGVQADSHQAQFCCLTLCAALVFASAQAHVQPLQFCGLACLKATDNQSQHCVGCNHCRWA